MPFFFFSFLSGHNKSYRKIIFHAANLMCYKPEETEGFRVCVHKCDNWQMLVRACVCVCKFVVNWFLEYPMFLSSCLLSNDPIRSQICEVQLPWARGPLLCNMTVWKSKLAPSLMPNWCVPVITSSHNDASILFFYFFLNFFYWPRGRRNGVFIWHHYLVPPPVHSLTYQVRPFTVLLLHMGT